MRLSILDSHIRRHIPAHQEAGLGWLVSHFAFAFSPISASRWTHFLRDRRMRKAHKQLSVLRAALQAHHDRMTIKHALPTSRGPRNIHSGNVGAT